MMDTRGHFDVTWQKMVDIFFVPRPVRRSAPVWTHTWAVARFFFVVGGVNALVVQQNISAGFYGFSFLLTCHSVKYIFYFSCARRKRSTFFFMRGRLKTLQDHKFFQTNTQHGEKKNNAQQYNNKKLRVTEGCVLAKRRRLLNL